MQPLGDIHEEHEFLEGNKGFRLPIVLIENRTGRIAAAWSIERPPA